MVVGFVLKDGEGSVELLGEDCSHYLVRKGHLRQRNLAIGALVDSIREAIRATDNKDQALDTRRHTTLQDLGELYGAVLRAVLVEEREVVGVADKAQDSLALEAFLLRLREFAGVADVGEGGDGKTHIVVYALGIHSHKGLYLLHIGFADDDKFYVHNVLWFSRQPSYTYILRE